MAKKRTSEAVNPLKQDAVAAVVGAPRKVRPEASTEPKPAPAAANKPKARRTGTSGRKPPQQKKQGTQWTEEYVQLKARVRERDAEVIKMLVAKLASKTGSNPSEANVARALWSLFMQLEDELDGLATVPLRKPGYSDREGTAIYEDEIAQLLHKCFRRLKPIGSDQSVPNDRSRTKAS